MPTRPKDRPASKPAGAPVRMHAKLEVVVHRAEEGGSWAEVPTLPGGFSQAETLAELRRNVQQAVDLYVEDAPAPTPKASGRDRREGKGEGKAQGHR